MTCLERTQRLLEEVIHIQFGGVVMSPDVQMHFDRLLPARKSSGKSLGSFAAEDHLLPLIWERCFRKTDACWIFGVWNHGPR